MSKHPLKVVLAAFGLTAFLLLSEHGKIARESLRQMVELTADKKSLELNSSFAIVEKSVEMAKTKILDSIDEERILTDEDYEKSYMEELSSELSSLAQFSSGVVAIYFRMNAETFGGTRGIFMERGGKREAFLNVKPTDILQYSPTDTEHVGWYYLPIWKKSPTWVAPYENRNINIHMISYVAPIYRNEQLLGVVGMDINLAKLEDIVDLLPMEGMLGILIGQERSLVYYNDARSMKKNLEQAADTNAIIKIFSEKKDSDWLTKFKWKNEKYYGTSRTLENSMTLVVALSVKSILEAQKKQIISLILSFVLITTLATILLTLALKHIIQPINLISDATTKLARGELNISLPYKANNELGQLADNIRKMMNQLKEYINYIHEQTEKERQEKENAQAESKSKSEFLASIYLSLHEIDLNEDTFKEIQSHSDISRTIKETYETVKHAQTVLNQVMEKRVQNIEKQHEEIFKFIDFSTLENRMKGRNSISQEFKGVLGNWCRARFILEDRNKDGTLHRVLWAIENIDEEKKVRQELQNERDKMKLVAEKSAADSRAKTEFLASMYISLHEIDLENGTFQEIHSRQDIEDAVNHAIGTSSQIIQQVLVKTTDERTRDDLLQFVDFSTLNERMADKITIAQEFLGAAGKWCRGRFIAMDRNKDGKLKHVLWAVEYIDAEKKEREKLQSERDKMRLEAERQAAASQAKSAFLANMSHEIRTPINAVLGMDEMILREATDKTILGYATNIKTAGSSLLSIINDILDFSKIEAGKMELLPENYDISSVVVDLVNMIRDRAKAKNLQFVLKTESSLPKTLFGDSVRIKQCILNLLTNAVKYTKVGTVTFSVGFDKIDDNRINLKVSVEDTGSGIKKEDMAKLLTPFERIEEEKNKTIEGTGLGMSIVTRMLSMMHTHLDVQSEYGKGSIFSFLVEQTV